MGTKISGLTQSSSLTGTEILPIVQSGATVKATAQAIADLRVVPVSSVAGRTGAVTLTKTDVGLANVDNTTDLNKPISTATSTALGLKFPVAGGTVSGGLTVTGPFTANGATQLAAWQSSQGGTVNGSLGVTDTATVGSLTSSGNVSTTAIMSAAQMFSTGKVDVYGDLSVLSKVAIGAASGANSLEIFKNANEQAVIQITNPNTQGGSLVGISLQKSNASKTANLFLTETVCGMTVGSGYSEFTLNIPSIQIIVNSATALGITAQRNIYCTPGTQAMTNGFFYIPKASGAPSGTPTAITGCAPMYFDSTNNRFYIHNGTAWKSVLLA